MTQGFFAYSTNPINSEASVEEAIRRINKDRGKDTLVSWKDTSTNGNIVIHNVIDSINSVDYFYADLTGMSNNVLFELGYAIAKKKNTFLIFDKTYKSSQWLYQNLTCLNSLTYSSYSNSDDIYEHLTARLDGRQRKKLPINNYIESPSPRGDRKALLYLKSHVNTEFSRRVSNKVEDWQLPCIIDERTEIGIPGLRWYIDHLNSVPLVLVELSSTNIEGYKLHNAKCSFIAGLAYGLERELLMVAAIPYEAPIDYRELLLRSNNPQDIEAVVKDFLKNATSKAVSFIQQAQIIESVAQVNTSTQVDSSANFQNIAFGQLTAESEGNLASQYYLNIWNLDSIISTNYKIIVARKGVGKTATLKALKVFLEEKSVENHVSVIEPSDLDIETLLYLMKELLEHEKSHLVQTTWKFLIYTNIVQSLYYRIGQRKRHISAYNSAELEFANFVKNNNHIFIGDLYERFEVAIEKVKLEINSASKSPGSDSKRNINDKISEVFHVSIFGEIKYQLGKLLKKDKLQKIVILIDNLDKAWKRTANFEIQASWILGLLTVGELIVRDLSRIENGRTEGLAFNLTVFLRSDIFQCIKDKAAEPDKLIRVYLKWNDKEALFRAIDTRLAILNDGIKEGYFWEKYVDQSINDQFVKDYIFSKILPRPRDLVYFLERAASIAKTRGHNKIVTQDFEEAHKEYSDWVASLMAVESEAMLGKKLDDKFMQFLLLLGVTNVVDQDEIFTNIKEAELPILEEKYEEFIDHLVSLSILGRETKINQFEYEYDFDNKVRLKQISKRLSTKRYRLHDSLVPYTRCEVVDL